MATMVLIAEAATESKYTEDHIRYLVRNKLVNGAKKRGIWLVDLPDLQRYEQQMSDLGVRKFDPTRGEAVVKE